MNGQERRAWLDDLIARYVVPAIPPEMRGQVAAVNSAMNPVQAIGDSMAAGRQMGATGLSMPQRVEAAGNMLSGVAGVVAPAVAASRMGGQAANALAEGLAGMTAPQRNALADFGTDEFGGITLWHGSPHDFDRFDMSKIGTGEGAQAYGHGLYFAENEGVARAYRNTLSDTAIVPDGTPDLEKRAAQMALTFGGNTPEGAMAWLGKFKSGAKHTSPTLTPELIETVAKKFAIGEFRPGGRLYQVDVAADPADFLDWDKPLSEQPAKVREAVFDNYKVPGWQGDKVPLRSVMQQFADGGLDPMKAAEPYYLDQRGGYAALSSQMGSKGAAETLREAGIPGIRYLDAGSRGAGDGSRNYVVFDDRLITILKKYGALPAAFGGALAANPDQAQAGGVTLTGQPPEPGYLSFGQIAGAPAVASGPVGPLAAVSHGTNALARLLYDQMPGQPGPMTPPQPVQKPDGSWGW